MKFYGIATAFLGFAVLAGCAAPAGDVVEIDRDRSAMDTPPPADPPADPPPAVDPPADPPADPPVNPPPSDPDCGGEEEPEGPSCGAYGGRAYVVGAKLLGLPVFISDTGNLPAAGGSRTEGLPKIEVLGIVQAALVTAKVKGQSEKTEANATVADVAIDLGGLNLGGLDGVGPGLGNTLQALLGKLSIHADAVVANSNASCEGASGSSTIANLTINGGKITVSGQPNQVIDILPGNFLGLDAKIIVNEQIDASAGDKSAMKVNALHVTVKLGNAQLADVVVSSASAEYQCCEP